MDWIKFFLIRSSGVYFINWEGSYKCQRLPDYWSMSARLSFWSLRVKINVKSRRKLFAIRCQSSAKYYWFLMQLIFLKIFVWLSRQKSRWWRLCLESCECSDTQPDRWNRWRELYNTSKSAPTKMTIKRQTWYILHLFWESQLSRDVWVTAAQDRLHLSLGQHNFPWIRLWICSTSSPPHLVMSM